MGPLSGWEKVFPPRHVPYAWQRTRPAEAAAASSPTIAAIGVIPCDLDAGSPFSIAHHPPHQLPLSLVPPPMCHLLSAPGIPAPSVHHASLEPALVCEFGSHFVTVDGSLVALEVLGSGQCSDALVACPHLSKISMMPKAFKFA
jgi:hypothetical protein